MFPKRLQAESLAVRLRAGGGQVKGTLRKGEKGENEFGRQERKRAWKGKTNKLTSESLVYCWVGTQ